MIASRYRLAVATLLTPLLASAAAGPERTHAQAPEVLEASIAGWHTAAQALRVPGAAVAVVGPDGPRLIETIGWRDVDKELPVTPDTLFYIASMTKPFVALGTVLLEDRGLIDLNRPVRTYLPRFRLADFTESITITVRDLLAHRRGLQDYPITFGEAFSGQMNEERFYRLLTRVEAVGELDYANLHYTLLGRIIESVSGTGWKEYVHREVLGPAAMTRSTTRAAPLAEDSDAAVPYAVIGGRLQATRLKTDRTMHAAGGMLSTVDDLARWVQIHLAGGRLDGEVVFPAEVIRAMQKPQIYEDDPSPFIADHKRVGWGLGWDIHEDRGARLIYHGGSYEGWAASMSFMPELDTGVVVLTNNRTGGQLLSYLIALDIYDRLRGLEPRDLLPGMAAMLEERNDEPESTADGGGPTQPLDRYTGRFANEDWGTVEIWIEDDGLRARIGDLPLPLVWTGPDTFIADGDNEGRFEFGRDGRVAAVLLTELAAGGEVRFARE